MNSIAKQQDIPLLMALVILALVLGSVFILGDLNRIDQLYVAVNSLWINNGAIMSASFILALSNFIFSAILLRNLVGKHRQGSRLKALINSKDKAMSSKLRNFATSVGFSATAFYIMREFGGAGKEFIGLYDAAFFNYLVSIGIDINVSVSFGLTLHCLPFFARFFSSVSGPNKILRSYPECQNQLVLGTSGEESGTPEWELIGERGLCGNILVTGSIGTGKTQGTMLTYLDQLLKNFNPSPSVLAIDPKRSFIRKLERIAVEAGLEDKILTVSLSNDMTFNPIYFEKPLKAGRFLIAAHMIRTAAVNALGSGGDNIFWQQSAFNLIKNCVVYCASQHEYYTLQDIYKAMLKACESDTSEDANVCSDMHVSLEKGTFDTEETANIKMSIDYFRGEYCKLDPKLKTGVLATATSFLNQFQEHRAAETFCPRKEDLKLLTMNDVVDKGLILLLDIENKALARSMGTFFKQHYQESVLDRISNPNRSKERLAITAIDEYPDVVSVGDKMSEGDESFLAKGREGNSLTIAATQSLRSLEDKIGRGSATDTLIQNFRTTIVCHSSDLKTINWVKELYGREEKTRKSHTFSELSQKASRNYLEGGIKHEGANVTESVSEAQVLDYSVTGKELSRLRTFESVAQIFDGTNTVFKKLYLKPYFLKGKIKNWSHSKVLKSLTAVMVIILGLSPGKSQALPNVCTVVKTPAFNSCMGLKVGGCTCGYPPHPCASFSYYIPVTFVEVMPDKKSTFFSALPGAASQMSSTSLGLPFGAEGDFDTQSFQSHSLPVPFSSYVLGQLACNGTRPELTCFDAMSEHIDWHWRTGKGDLLQPKFLAWQAAPKACLIKGAVEGLAGGEHKMSSGGNSSCSFPIPTSPMLPISSRSACNGWGTFFPRYGSYTGGSQTAGALMIASRLRSLGSDVWQSVPTNSDEKFQMIYPQSSTCFREGENVGFLETMYQVREERRLLNGKPKGYLFVIWKRVSCCKEYSSVASTYAVIGALNAVCAGLGDK